MAGYICEKCNAGPPDDHSISWYLFCGVEMELCESCAKTIGAEELKPK